MTPAPTRAEIEHFLRETPRLKRLVRSSVLFMASCNLAMIVCAVFAGSLFGMLAAIYITCQLISAVRVGLQVKEAETWIPILRAGLPLFR